MPPPIVHSLCRRELVAMFMESPFYFELSLRERLTLVQRLTWHGSRCRGPTRAALTQTVTLHYHREP